MRIFSPGITGVHPGFVHPGYSPLLKHPNLNDGIPELYRPKTDTLPESRIPLCYDWYGNGGFRLYYIPTHDMKREHQGLLASHIEDAFEVNEACVREFKESLLGDQDLERVSKELEAHESVVEVVGSPVEGESPSYTLHLKEVSQDPSGRNVVKKSVINTQHPDDRMIKGTQFGLKRGRNLLSNKDFHELYGHLGYC